MIKLIGIAIVAAGFALRLNTLLVVVLAAIVTGLVAGLSFHTLVALIGQFFIDNRYLVLPVVLMVPIVGLLERHGLQERVAALIRRTRAASAGRVLWIYQLLREGTSTIGLSIGNHASMVRPLIAPMAEAAAAPPAEAAASALPAEAAAASPAGAAPAGQVSDPTSSSRTIRAHAAASENVGNFFADDILVAVGALLLIKGFFDNVGVAVDLADLQRWSLPTALWVIAVGWWRYRALDRSLARRRLAAAEKSPRRA